MRAPLFPILLPGLSTVALSGAAVASPPPTCTVDLGEVTAPMVTNECKTPLTADHADCRPDAGVRTTLPTCMNVQRPGVDLASGRPD